MATKTDLAALRDKCRNNRLLLRRGAICGCFYCLSEFPFGAIEEWIDSGETALCPRCGIDAVLGFNTASVDQQILRDMHQEWFEKGRSLTPEEWKEAVDKNTWPWAQTKPEQRK